MLNGVWSWLPEDNVIMIGPRFGKTMLAKRLPTIC
jgi:hypothetical protein